MPRQQLPPQIKRLEVRDRRAGKTVVRYQLTLDSGVNPQTGKLNRFAAGTPQRSKRVTRCLRSVSRRPLTSLCHAGRSP